MAAGLGIKYDRITLDYGYKNLGPLGDYHAFTLNYSRKSKFRARDEVLLERALEKYAGGKYASALSLARAAVAVNPYNFKAQALAQKIQLEMDRLDEMAVTLAYTANTKGHVASEWVGGKAVGGLARRQAKLTQMKGANGKILILDAGDLTFGGTDSLKARFVHSAYARMPYDAVNVGASELAMGTDNWDYRLPFLATQRPLSDIHGGLLTEKTLALKNGAEVMVLGAMDPRLARSDAVGGKELEAVAEAVQRRAGKGRDGRILVLMLHAGLQEAFRIAKLAPSLDVILLSGEAQALGSPMKAGKTLICSPGMGGTHVGDLTLQLNRKGQIRSFRHFLIPLDADVPEDVEMKKFLEPAIIDPNSMAIDEYDEDFRAQIIAYVHAEEPGAGGALFLRDLRTGRNYPVPAPGLLCSRPALGYGKNRLAFAGENGSGAREIFLYQPGRDKLDTLTAMGGQATELRWILHNNALLAGYAKGGKADLYRIDPWSREIRDLTHGRFGDIRGFDVDKKGERLILNAAQGGKSTLWATNPEFTTPLAIAAEKAILGSPRWNPQGDKVAFLVSADSANSGGELRVFDFATKAMLKGTQESRVRGFSWSADGKRIFYSAGAELADLNAFQLDSLSLVKVTSGTAAARNEESPSPKILEAREGLLFEAATADSRKILWMDTETRKERVLVDSAGYNSLR
jgi:hypothetical protein